MRRLFSLIVLVVILVVAFYWFRTGSLPSGRALENLKDIKEIKPPDLKILPGALKDAALAGSVRVAFGLNRDLRPYRLEVESKDAVVRLWGALPSAALKEMAESVCAAVPNVRQVVNEVKVDPSVKAEPVEERSIGERVDDETLEVQVRLALTLRKELEGSSIHVSVLKKVATLSGEASAAQRPVALKAASETPGVLSVTDAFDAPVAGLGKGREAVERALSGNANLSHDGIQVVERGGRLALVGHVRTGAEKDLAGLLAERAAGVPVDNSLDVK
jgi:osmotically-inducible protein OsmY